MTGRLQLRVVFDYRFRLHIDRQIDRQTALSNRDPNEAAELYGFNETYQHKLSGETEHECDDPTRPTAFSSGQVCKAVGKVWKIQESASKKNMILALRIKYTRNLLTIFYHIYNELLVWDIFDKPNRTYFGLCSN